MKLVGWSSCLVLWSVATTGCLKAPFGDPGPFPEGPPPDLGFFDGDGFDRSPIGPQPSFGTTVTASTPPAPLSGGTLRVLPDGKTAIASDPDRDQVYVADLSQAKLTFTIALQAGDEPGRSVDDAAGRVHVVARRGGALVTIDPVKGVVAYRRAVCPAPRGVAYEAATDLVHVACAGGELVSLPAAGGAATRTIALDQDLRDVVVSGAYLWITTFRTANLLLVDANGTLAHRYTIPPQPNGAGQPMGAAVAWRIQPLPDGRMAMVHQLGQNGDVQIVQGGYGGNGPGCGGIVVTALAVFDAQLGLVSDVQLQDPVLPADLAIAHAQGTLMVLSAGNSHTAGQPQVTTYPLNVTPGKPGDMGPAPTDDLGPPGTGCVTGQNFLAGGEVTALAYDGQDQMWAQTREPAALQLVTMQALPSGPASAPTTIALSTESRADTGWAVFHSNSGAGLACASCHPEGGEDGRVWQLAGLGPRRTQSLRGHIGGTEPFHWSGSLPDFDALVGEVYIKRMSGPLLASDQKTALFAWVNTIPTLPHSPPADPASVMRGQALFEDVQNVGCSTCHAGPQLTNNATVDVGTGGQFNVPRLVGVGWRAPFLHHGCAVTLADRFGACGGGDAHGHTSQLTTQQRQDLVNYLSTL